VRDGVILTKRFRYVSGGAAAVFVLVLAAQWASYRVLQWRAPYASTYQELTEMVGLYQRLSWAMLGLVVASAVLAVVTVGIRVAQGNLPQQARTLGYWWVVTGVAFGAHTCWTIMLSGGDVRTGTSVLRSASATPTAQDIATTVTAAMDDPFPVTSIVGLLIAAAWSLVHRRLLTALTG
jgi:hypothetical protein